MQVEVECYSGARYAERPRRLVWGGEELEITAILTQARLPEQLRFEVRLENGMILRLTYQIAADSWHAEPVE